MEILESININGNARIYKGVMEMLESIKWHANGRIHKDVMERWNWRHESARIHK
ncbi:hypothetical protein ACJMK2_039545, partial [Sinanodonta woodiana]